MEEQDSHSPKEDSEIVLDLNVDETEFAENSASESSSTVFSEEKNGSNGVRGKKEILAEQMKSEGKKFFYLLLNLMTNPQEEVHEIYAKKPKFVFGLVIGLNIVLVAFYRSYSSSLVTELKVGVLSGLLVFGALFGYLRKRDSKAQWYDALAVLGIANFPLLPCVLLANLLAVIHFSSKLSEMLYTTGNGFSFLFAFLCFIEIFKFPVKLSIYTIPVIFVLSEFLVRALF